ncbi:MAG: radical SAM protein [Deltaproteobacteria bacterium]|nr:radical SAM protein [Deltaproteobacteria bacterium]
MMTGGNCSLILLPTLRCNAACGYCFEREMDHELTLEQLSVVIRKVMDHMEQRRLETLSIYWQGGEVMTMPPAWFAQARDVVQEAAERRHKPVLNYIQSNMMAYNLQWNGVISRMFGNNIGTSMDFPNLHRKLKGGGPSEYEKIWEQKILEAREAGIEVGIISIPNNETLDMGADRFYAHFVEELGITSFQINTPFPGGLPTTVKQGYPLDISHLSKFMVDLANIWMDRGRPNGVRVGPFDKLLDYFLYGNKDLLCIWRDNCVNEFVCIDPRGHVAQCDCWVTSYPEFRFGNIFDCDNLSDLLGNSQARRRFQARPGLLVQREDCLDCGYLTLCHGGCPVRAYTVTGDLYRKDPYCDLYKTLFSDMEEAAVNLGSSRPDSCANQRMGDAASSIPSG